MTKKIANSPTLALATEAEILAEVVAAATFSRRRLGDIDPHVLARKEGCNVVTIIRKLQGLVDEGKLEKVRLLENGVRPTVFRVVKQKP
jgi:hypothetical protein